MNLFSFILGFLFFTLGNFVVDVIMGLTELSKGIINY